MLIHRRSQIIILLRHLLLGVSERPPYSKDLSLRDLCCRIGSNDLILANGIQRVRCWLWKLRGLG